jgi:hypothetical protein
VSISTYAELQTAIASWANKSNLTARIPDFITLAEAQINRKLRTRWQEEDLAATAVDSSFNIAIPADAVAVKSFWRNADPTWRIEQKDLSYIVENRDTSGGLARFYAWQGSNWTFDGAGDDITGVYYIKVPALSDADPTNWLLTAHPDLYLYASLEQCAKYLRDVEGALAWRAERTALTDELNSVSTADQVSGGPLIARPRTPLSAWRPAR